jgi:hypothetical protein
MSNPHTWLKSIGAVESLREVASRAGVSHATLSRQISNGRFLFDTTLDLARAYGAPVVPALVANGHLTPTEGGMEGIEKALAAATDEQLVVEVGRRLGLGGSILFDAPASEAMATASNVIDGRFPDANVSAPGEDEPTVKQPPSRHREAAKKGTRKAEKAPHAE